MPKISNIIESKFPYEPTSSQRRFFAMLDQMIGRDGEEIDSLVVRGYAGTGKTTVISTLVNVLTLFNYKYALLAPTGRAAKVFSSYSGKKAYTIHKIIYRQEVNPKTGEMKFVRRRNYFKRTFFIVDEASMVSDERGFLNESLLHDLLDFVFEHHTNKLVLVGDNAQLPPVGSSQSPALDLRYLKDRFGLDAREVELSEVLRQAEGSGVLLNATRLRKAVFDSGVSISLDTASHKDIFRMNTLKLEDGIRYAFDKFGMESTAIICRSNWQAVRYNEYIRRNILFREDELEAGDVIMVVKNNYAIVDPESEAGFIANGEFAEVRKIISFEDQFGFRFADVQLQLMDYPEMPAFEAKIFLDTLHSNTASLSTEENNRLYHQVIEDYREITSKKKFKEAIRQDPYLNALQVKFAYALTCHKSQGGQWKAIFIDEGNRNDSISEIDHRRWLYTALTRAEEEVFLINFSQQYFV